MSIIAVLDILLGARTEKLDAGLDRSKAKVSKFKDDLVSRLPGGGFLNQGASTLANFGPAGLAAAGAVAAVGAAAVATGIAIAGIRQQLGAIDEIAKSADKAGVSFREMQAFRLAVGESTGLGAETADKALSQMQVRLVEARKGTGPLKEQLDRIGLDAGKLIEAGPIEAIKQLSVATKSMKSPTDQLSLAYDLFGGKAAGLVTTLRAGPDALQEVVAWSDKMGLSLSQAQAKQVEAANDAWGRVKEISTGVFRQLAAETAPVLKVISDEILGVAGSFGGLQTILPGIVDGVTMFAGAIYDVFELSTAVSRVWLKILSGDFAGAGDTLKSAFDFGTGSEWVAKVQAARAAAEEAANKPLGGDVDVTAIEAQREASEAAKKAAEEKDQAAQKLRDSVRQRLGGLREEIVTLRQGAEAVERMRLARQGATDQQLAGFDAMQREKKELEELQGAMERGAAIREQFATPQQKFQKELTDLRGLLNVGAIDFGTFASAAREAATKFGKQDDKQRDTPPPSFGALQKGSVEAFSAALRNQKAGEQQTLQKEGNKLLAAINNGIAQLAQQRGQIVHSAG